MKQKQKLIYFGVAGFFALLGLVLSHTYRPYIYRNHIWDCHIADTIGNLVAVPAILFLMYAMYGYEKMGRIEVALGKIVLVLCFYEGLNLFFGGFDYLDIIATFISAALCYVAFRKVFKSA